MESYDKQITDTIRKEKHKQTAQPMKISQS